MSGHLHETIGGKRPRIDCDGPDCSDYVEGGSTFDSCRRAAASLHWTNPLPGVDYCSDHSLGTGEADQS